jgi:F0F1-type ATP synthase assembly protein I|tara:strand:- start:458 stop:685 length:228 start_codon:yes stop_codon:yes gene_type:complete
MLNIKYAVKKISKITLGISIIIFVVAVLKVYLSGKIDNANIERLFGSLIYIIPCALVAAIALFVKDERDKAGKGQ